MTKIHHLNCGILHKPPREKAICHCLLIEDSKGLAFIDTGIGLFDAERLGQPLIDSAGFQFHESMAAIRQLQGLGVRAEEVTDIILTHCDPDHVGGLVDFPHAQVHVTREEFVNVQNANPRYVPSQFEHGPNWNPLSESSQKWFGLEARPVPLDFDCEVLMIPLFGHTLGHAAVAIQREQQGQRWTLHIGDAYYLRLELIRDDHPVSQLAQLVADDDAARAASLDHLRRLVRDHSEQIDLFGYHDLTEFPGRLEG